MDRRDFVFGLSMVAFAFTIGLFFGSAWSQDEVVVFSMLVGGIGIGLFAASLFIRERPDDPAESVEGVPTDA